MFEAALQSVSVGPGTAAPVRPTRRSSTVIPSTSTAPARTAISRTRSRKRPAHPHCGWLRLDGTKGLVHHRGMDTPQGGIFALGTTSHAYLEFDLRSARAGAALVRGVSALREPRTTMGGVNLVAGFRPELWRVAAPDDAAADVVGFNEDVVGLDGLVMPATQHDAVLWLSGGAYDVVFDTPRGVMD